MVPRCGYYVQDNAVHRITCNIDWNLGFTKEAKHIYIRRLEEEIHKRMPGTQVLEVTSASEHEYGKALSPIFIKFDNGESMEDAWGRLKANGVHVNYDGYQWPLPAPSVAFVHYYCYYAEHMIPIIRLVDVFTDVFYNPSKEGGTQAEACAILKLLDQQGNLGKIERLKDFLEWYDEYVKI